MTRRLSDATPADYDVLLEEMRRLAAGSCVQETAQEFVDRLYGRFGDSLVLLRLFITLPCDRLPEEDRRFVDRRGRDTHTSRLIHGATPIFTLLGTRGRKPEWNDRRASTHFRCIPLASTAFVASLSMLSRQLESVGFDLGLIDAWETKVASSRGADRYRGMLHIGDAGADRDGQGRMVVPRQEFVVENGVKSVFGLGSGYPAYPSLVTLFAFTDEELAPDALAPCAGLLEHFITSTASLVGQERFF